MADLTQDVNAEIMEERVAVADGLKDSTTLFVKRIPALRDIAEEAPHSNLKGTNEALRKALPD
jgi:hypothetical protein